MVTERLGRISSAAIHYLGNAYRTRPVLREGVHVLGAYAALKIGAKLVEEVTGSQPLEDLVNAFVPAVTGIVAAWRSTYLSQSDTAQDVLKSTIAAVTAGVMAHNMDVYAGPSQPLTDLGKVYDHVMQPATAQGYSTPMLVGVTAGVAAFLFRWYQAHQRHAHARATVGPAGTP